MRTALAILLICGSALAQSDDLDKLKKDLEDAKKRIDLLEKERERAKLEEELKTEMGTDKEKPASGALASADLGGGVKASLLDLSLDILVAGGTSTANNDEILTLQGGDHDPNRRGFTVENVELVGTGAVDPYFTAQANVVFLITPDGETKIELEEAFFVTTSLPAGFQVKGGQMYEQFGRHNAQHPHSFMFVDSNVVNTRFFGADGLRSQGLEASWLAPTPWYLLLLVGAYNANGETEYSFINEEEPPFYASEDGRDIRTLREIQYLARLLQNFDLGDTIAMNIGTSWAHGPNSTGHRADTDIYGVDFYARWKPVVNDHGWPFVQVQAEWMGRSYEQATGFDEAGTAFEHEVFWDWGWYAQVVWGFTRRWTVGVRWDQAKGEVAHLDREDDRFDSRRRASAALTFYPSEFSKIRLQYNYDHATHLSAHDDDEHSVWLQVEVLLGKHGAHKF
ncbi:MAG: hypothetical protein HYY18_21825 [Planctomycetes bacterium]|nr:hypothetical protein [Planctomycetota bacterium]